MVRFFRRVKLKNLNLDALDSPFRSIYEEAVVAGRDAEDAYFAKYGEPLYCGFAWVEIPNGRSPFVNWCKKVGLGSKHWKKGWSIWRPTDNHTQSMDIQEVGAKAFCDVLRKNGIEAHWMSRAD
jgi:hypothetical protein